MCQLRIWPVDLMQSVRSQKTNHSNHDHCSNQQNSSQQQTTTAQSRPRQHQNLLQHWTVGHKPLLHLADRSEHHQSNTQATMTVTITITEDEATITCGLDQAKQFLKKNPSAQGTTDGTVVQLVYQLEELQVPTSLLKTVRRGR